MSNEPTPNESEDLTSDQSTPNVDAPQSPPDGDLPNAQPDSSDDPTPAAENGAELIEDGAEEDSSGAATDPVSPGDSVQGAGYGAYVPPQPPPPATVPPVRRLVRDPYSRLGGVASGISHYYGIDVSLVRLAFILGVFFSGIGLILYFLAWLIIPRADYWPPIPAGADARTVSPIEGRELAYGLLAVGILLAIFAGGGSATRLVVSVGLVGAGIWMLMQPPRSDSKGGSTTSDAGSPAAAPPGSPAAAPPGSGSGGPPSPGPAPDVPPSWQPAPADAVDAVAGSDDEFGSGLPGSGAGSVAAGSAGPATSTYPTTTVYVPSPVPPRRRRIWPVMLVVGLLVLPILFALLAFSFLIGLGTGGFNGDFDARTLEIRPATVADIPDDINQGAGEITVDLTRLDQTDFADLTSPHKLNIDLNAGSVVVELPEDLLVSVDASAGAGDVTVFSDSRDGIRPRVDISDEDAVLELDIRVGVGEITVER
ncbi:MAG: PspC domain-containing protein [Acidimicrobiia bacterium]|nr:PspC domain-containing protein [Acidimicrobiia bacterium]